MMTGSPCTWTELQSSLTVHILYLEKTLPFGSHTDLKFVTKIKKFIFGVTP